jgi:hypothetical protein
MLTIHDRPFPVDDRSEAGHTEGDLIIGNNHSTAIGTLVERQTRMVRLVHLPRSDADSLHAALVARMQDLPPTLMRSITWDQGTEMARHLATTDKLGAPSTSATPDHPGNAAATKTPTDCFATTSPKASASETTHRLTCWPSNTNSTADPARSPRPLPRRAIHRTASLKESVSVATLTRTHPVVSGLGLDRRQQSESNYAKPDAL